MTVLSAAEIAQILTDGPSSDLAKLVDPILDLRAKIPPLPAIEDGPRAALEYLAEVRSAMDRVDVALTTAVRFRSRIREAFKLATAAHDDAWAAATGGASKRGRGQSGWGEPAPRERYAEADLATLNERRQMRKFDRWLDESNDTVDIIQRTYRYLDEVRKDLHLILRGMSVESSLER
jgi:hypothetical protein